MYDRHAIRLSLPVVNAGTWNAKLCQTPLSWPSNFRHDRREGEATLYETGHRTSRKARERFSFIHYIHLHMIRIIERARLIGKSCKDIVDIDNESRILKGSLSRIACILIISFCCFITLFL